MNTIINGCVLFPHRCSWGTKAVSGKRLWETEIVAALPGGETRQALRSVSRRSLNFMVAAQSLQERVRLEARIDQAASTGYACAPLHGRACSLAQPAAGGTNSITLAASAAWIWQPGDYAILIVNDTTFDVQPVTTVVGAVLDFPGNLNFAWPATALVWPLIFGKYTGQKAAAWTSWHSAVQIGVAEVTSARSVQIGNAPAVLPGIGQQIIGQTNQVQ
jgi:hypothetical protein